MPDIQRWTVTEPYLPLRCELGEGPYYETATHSLRWLDILAKRLHTIELAAGPASVRTITLEDAVSVTADIGHGTGDSIMVAAKYGFAIMDRRTGALRYIRKVWEAADGPGKAEAMRFNDGAVDPAGRFYAGTMTDPTTGPILTGAGTLFRLDPDLSLHRVLAPVTVPNGLGWSPDGRTMYVTDSGDRTIYAFDYDVTTGRMDGRRAWWVAGGAAEGGGAPDGCAVDVEGGVWSAVWGEGRVVRIVHGTVVGEVRVPARCVSCPRFVGDELWITSAGSEQQTGGDVGVWGGGLFRVGVGVRGREVGVWRGAVG